MDPACWVQSRWFICSKGHVLVVHTSGRDSLLQLQFVRILIWWSILFVFFWMFSLNNKMVAWRKENALTVIYLCHHIWRHLKELSSCLIQKCKQLNKKAFFFPANDPNSSMNPYTLPRRLKVFFLFQHFNQHFILFCQARTFQADTQKFMPQRYSVVNIECITIRFHSHEDPLGARTHHDMKADNVEEQ